MYSTFEALAPDKKEKILEACIEEFAVYGYEKASTNRIVKNVKMSKGSLFKYFNTKEELYIYVIDYAVYQVTSEITRNIKKLPEDIYNRIFKMAEIEFEIYIKYPLFYKLFKEAFSGTSEISQKLKEKHTIKGSNFFDNAFENIEINNSKFEKNDVLNLFKYVLYGYNSEFMRRSPDEQADIENLKKEYLKGIQFYMEMIRSGVDK